MAYVSNEVVITVEQAPPPPAPVSVTLSVDKTRCRVGETVTFTVKVTGLDGFYRINIVERTVGVLVYVDTTLSSSGTVVTLQWTPTSPGTYYVHAEVTTWPTPTFW